jgi:hypothetical protein
MSDAEKNDSADASGCPMPIRSEFDGMPESDIDYWRLTGVKPAPAEQRQCVMCKEMGHYYFECNGGEFFRSIGDYFGLNT